MQDQKQPTPSQVASDSASQPDGTMSTGDGGRQASYGMSPEGALIALGSLIAFGASAVTIAAAPPAIGILALIGKAGAWHPLVTLGVTEAAAVATLHGSAAMHRLVLRLEHGPRPKVVRLNQ